MVEVTGSKGRKVEVNVNKIIAIYHLEGGSYSIIYGDAEYSYVQVNNDDYMKVKGVIRKINQKY